MVANLFATKFKFTIVDLLQIRHTKKKTHTHTQMDEEQVMAASKGNRFRASYLDDLDLIFFIFLFFIKNNFNG